MGEPRSQARPAPAKSGQAKAAPVRRGGFAPVRIGVSIARIARPVLGKRGFTVGAIVTEWAAIVGTELAAYTAPLKLSYARGSELGGTLVLGVAGGGAALELQHRTPQVIERVNAYFGWQAVSRLRFHQGGLPPRRRAAPSQAPRPLAPPEAERLTAELQAVDNPELHAALERLGRAVFGRVR